MIDSPFLIAKHIRHAYGSKVTIDDVNLSVMPGEIYSLVGPDGAGKTTMLRLICGALKARDGYITIGGVALEHRPEECRAQIGYLSQFFSLYEELTVMENIRFLAEVRGMSPGEWLPRSRENLAFVGLEEYTNRRAGRLSGGMKQKLALACALVNRPRLLLLDEPTTGVDPVTRQDFWQLIIRLAGEQGLAILVCTPYMDEASRCSRVGFLRTGKLIVEGSPATLRKRLQGRVLELSGEPLNLLVTIARADPSVQDVQRFGDRLHLRVEEGQGHVVITRLEKMIPAASGRIDHLVEIVPLLEDIFIELAEAKKESIK